MKFGGVFMNNCKMLFDKIDELYEKYLDIWEDVCNIESPTDYKEGVDKVAEYFIRMANKKKWNVEVFEHDVAGNVVCITMNPESKEMPITFSGHLDTVHPIGLFGTPAVRRDEENIYGPGVMDCKGGVVAAFLAMDALNECGYDKRPIQLILQSDEETGSKTSNKETVKYICDKAKNSVAFFNLEGSKSGTVVLERKGILRYRFDVFGKALHSSRCAEASNAILDASFKIIELEKMKDENGLTCNCGVINGGTVANTVAEKCSFIADIRFSTQEELSRGRELVKNIASVSNVKGCTCDVTEISFRPAMSLCDRNINLLEKMNSIYKNIGLPVLKARKCLSGSDAAYATEAGIPAVDNIGVEGSNIHSINEFAKLKSLAVSAKYLACFAWEI